MKPLHLQIWLATERWRLAVWPGYLAAIVAPLLSTAIRLALGDALVGYPFITFFPAILLTALIGGWGAAILATLLSALLASSYAIDASGNLLPQSASAWIGMTFFLMACAIIIALVHWLYDALDQLNRLNSDLEQRVEARTRQLTKANEDLIAEAKARATAEFQLRHSQKMQEIGQLTGGIAHDFNNMLAIIIGALDMAKRRMARGDMDIVKFVDAATDGARRAATLTQRLLSFSRQAPLSPDIIDINGVISGMEELLRRTLGETVQLEVVQGGGLWSTNVDPGELENAVLNLAVNARDAMPKGGRLTIETCNGHLDDDYAALHHEVEAGQYVVLTVTDTGSGMTKEVVERAFDVRPHAGTLLERVHRVQAHGIDVWCGMIVGFDHDDPTIFDVVPKFLAEARIATALIGMLHAIPTTPLYKRLKEEDRLSDDEGVDSIGTNVIPLGMSREQLRDGFVRVMQESYKPEAYFGRVDSQFIDQNFKFTLHQLPYWKSHRLNWIRRCLLNYIKFTVISLRLMRLVPDEGLTTRYRRQLWRVLRARWREPHILFVYSLKVAFHYHYTAITQTLSQVGEGSGAMPDAVRSLSRAKRRVPAQAAA